MAAQCTRGNHLDADENLKHCSNCQELKHDDARDVVRRVLQIEIDPGNCARRYPDQEPTSHHYNYTY